MVRFKNRYALCEIIFPDRHSEAAFANTKQESHVYNAVKNALLTTHGDYGLGSLQSSLSVKYLNIKTNIIIIRGERKHFYMLASAIVFINNIGHHKASLKTLHVGGSIRACQKFLINYHRRNMTLLFPKCTTEEQRTQVMQSIMEACDDLEVYGPKSKMASKAPVVSALSVLQSGEDDT